MKEYMSHYELSIWFHLTVALVSKLCKEMAELGEYGDFEKTRDFTKLVFVDAFEHYLKNGYAIKHGLDNKPYKEVE